MKVALVLTFCGLVMVLASPEHNKKDIEAKALQECSNEVGFFPDELDKDLSQEDFTPELKERYECSLACLFKKLRLMKANGEVDKEFILNHSPQLRLQDIRRSIEDCQSKNIEDTCKLAFCLADGGWFDLDRYNHLLL